MNIETHKIYRARPGDLERVENLLLINPGNPMIVLALQFDQISGYTGGVFLNNDALTLEDIAREIDACEIADREVPYPVIEVEFPEKIILDSIHAKDPEPAIIGEPQEHDASHLFPAVLDILGCGVKPAHLPLIGTPVYDWLDFLSQGDRDARAQAMQAFPHFHEDLLKDVDIQNAIDDRQPLLPLIAKKYNLSPQSARRLGVIEAGIGKAIAQDGRLTGSCFSPSNIPMLCKAVSWIRNDQMPETETDILAMTALFRAYSAFKTTNGADDTLPKRFNSTIKADQWATAHTFFRKEFLSQEMRGFLEDLSNKISTAITSEAIRNSGVDLEALQDISRQVWEKKKITDAEHDVLVDFMKAIASTAGYRPPLAIRMAISRHLACEFTPKEMREACVRWHHIRQTLEDQIMTSPVNITWSPLKGRVELGDVTARELHGSAMLKAQGATEKHCVGGYASRILAGTSEKGDLIFSLEQNDRILSTLHLEVTSPSYLKSFEVNIIEHKSTRNSRPCEVARAAAAHLEAALSDVPFKEMRTYLRGVEKNSDNIRDKLAGSVTMFGGNFFNPDLPEEIVETYRPVMPRKLKGLSVNSLDLGITRTLKDMGMTDQLAARLRQIGSLREKLNSIAPAEPHHSKDCAGTAPSI